VTFAHPLFLWGALAALIPLLVHLFDRRRAKPVRFGAIDFVLRSQKRTASRLRLRRLLLYALRTLLLLALPIALARPEFRAQGALTASEGPQATAVVVDLSRSMRFRDGETDADTAKKDARQAISGLLPEEPVSVVPCDGRGARTGALTFDHRAAMKQVEELQPSLQRADLTSCLEAAAKVLADSPLPGKRLVVASDFAAHGLRLDGAAPAVTGPKGEAIRPQVVLLDAARSHPVRPNRALLDFKAEPATQVGPRAWAFTFTVKNFSAAPVENLELRLEVDGQVVAKGFVEVPAQGTAQKVLSHRFEQGGLSVVKGSIAPDALPEDDARTVLVQVPKLLKVLLVNGAPSPQKYRDEAFFVEAALVGGSSPVEAVTRDADAAWKEDLSGYDVVFLMNVEAPPQPAAQALTTFVTKGGGLFISLGDRVEPDAYNAALGPLLPRPLRIFKTAVEQKDTEAQVRAARLSQLLTEHPVLAPFTGAAREGLLAARFFRYALLEARPAGAADDTQVLAALDDGAPLLAATRRGLGRVLLDTSTVDRDGTDFPVRTAFLPIIQRTALWLGGALEERVQLTAQVGESLVLPLVPGQTAASMSSPSGAPVPLSPRADGAVSAGPFTETGPFLAKDASGATLPGLSVAVVVEPSESDLTRVEGEVLNRWFGEESVQRVDEATGEKRQTPLWSYLLLVAALAFIAEGLLLAPSRAPRRASAVRP